MSSVRLKLPKDDSWKSECYQKVLWFTSGFMKTNTQYSVLSLSSFSSLDQCKKLGFPGGSVIKNLPANAGVTGSVPGLGGFHMPRSH